MEEENTSNIQFNFNKSLNRSSKLKKLIVIALILSVITIIALVIILQRQGIRQTGTQNPRNGTGSELDLSESERLSENRGFHISNLAAILPFIGENFSMSYDFDNDEYTVYINPAQQAQGEAEFEAYLKEKGIPTSSWITTLNRTNQPF